MVPSTWRCSIRCVGNLSPKPSSNLHWESSVVTVLGWFAISIQTVGELIRKRKMIPCGWNALRVCKKRATQTSPFKNLLFSTNPESSPMNSKLYSHVYKNWFYRIKRLTRIIATLTAGQISCAFRLYHSLKSALWNGVDTDHNLRIIVC